MKPLYMILPIICIVFLACSIMPRHIFRIISVDPSPFSGSTKQIDAHAELWVWNNENNSEERISNLRCSLEERISGRWSTIGIADQLVCERKVFGPLLKYDLLFRGDIYGVTPKSVRVRYGKYISNEQVIDNDIFTSASIANRYSFFKEQMEDFVESAGYSRDAASSVRTILLDTLTKYAGSTVNISNPTLTKDYMRYTTSYLHYDNDGTHSLVLSFSIYKDSISSSNMEPNVTVYATKNCSVVRASQRKDNIYIMIYDDAARPVKAFYVKVMGELLEQIKHVKTNVNNQPPYARTVN